MDIPHDVLNAIMALAIPIGLLQCFFGYRIFKFILALTGFLIGSAMAATIGYNASQQEVVALLAGLVGGFIGAALMVLLYFVGIFLLGAFVGAALGTMLFAMAETNPIPFVLFILAAIVGVLALVFQKFMIIIATAFGGAWNVVIGIAYFTTGAIDPTNIEASFSSGGTLTYIIVLCWLALGITGVIVQYKSAPPKEEEPREPTTEE